MAEIVLAIICILAGVGAAFVTILMLWAGGLQRAATGSSSVATFAIWFGLLAVAGIGAGTAILIF